MTKQQAFEWVQKKMKSHFALTLAPPPDQPNIIVIIFYLKFWFNEI